MKIFFWDFQDDNDIIRQWLLFTLNILVLAFTVFALFRTWRYYKQCMFEMMPLSINLIATFILLNLKLFEKGYEFDQIGHFIEIFTYFLFCYTFAIMYTVISKPELKRKMQRLWNAIMLVLLVGLVVVSILVFAGVISKKCEASTEQIPAIIGLAIEFVSFVPTGYYGMKILSKMMKKEETTPGLQFQMGAFTSQIYIKQRKKQIIIVLSVYLVSLLLRLFISIVTLSMWDSLFTCTQIDTVYILTSDSAAGQLVLIFAEVNQLLPHVVIPIAMYVVPLQRMRKSRDLSLGEGLIDEDQVESYEEDAANRVSSLLTSRLSEGSPTRRPIHYDGKYNFSDVVVSK